MILREIFGDPKEIDNANVEAFAAFLKSNNLQERWFGLFPDKKPEKKPITPTEALSPEFLRSFKDVYKLGDSLYENGWEPIGQGANGVVFARNDQNKIIKLVFWENGDRCWGTFIKSVKNRNNPHFPKIYDYYEEKYQYAVIEKLDELDASSWNKEFYIGFCSYIYYNKLSYYESRLWQWILRIVRRLSRQAAENFAKNNRTLVQALIETTQIIKSSKCNHDMRFPNFMQRSDGTIIITDPSFMDDID